MPFYKQVHVFNTGAGIDPQIQNWVESGYNGGIIPEGVDRINIGRNFVEVILDASLDNTLVPGNYYKYIDCPAVVSMVNI